MAGPIRDPVVPAASPHTLARAAVLFTNFFLIVFAYYLIKPASRSIYVEYLGETKLPYVWIGTALILMLFIGYYHRIVARHNRAHVVIGTCLIVGALLVVFNRLLLLHSAPAAVGFYLFVDVFSVVLVEQFWSLTNTLYRTAEAKRWYGLVGTGGLVGGVAGGAAAAGLLEAKWMQSEALLLVAAFVIGLIVLLTLWMVRTDVFHEARAGGAASLAAKDWRAMLTNRYVVLIGVLLLCAQLCEPLVEYQFMTVVAAQYHEMNERTAYLSWFFSALGMVSIAVNLALTPLIHRYLGGIAGLLVQPALVFVGSLWFWWQPVLLSGAILKVCDRGISYSINRASKEMLYIPIDPVHTYQIKAWIDMFGYRFFKMAGSTLILLLTQWLPLGLAVRDLSWLLLAVCVFWLYATMRTGREYARMLAEAGENGG
jgi:AAA family ATP:ADP antiporter